VSRPSSSACSSRPVAPLASAVSLREQASAKRAHSLVSAGISLGFLMALIAPCFVIKALAPETPAALSSLAHPITHAVPAVDAHKKPLRRA
jgi:hypothetical protein